MKTDIIGEAAKIIEDNPVRFDEEFLLEMLKVRFRWPKKSIEVIATLVTVVRTFLTVDMIHLFLINGMNCIVEDSLLCLIIV